LIGFGLADGADASGFASGRAPIRSDGWRVVATIRIIPTGIEPNKFNLVRGFSREVLDWISRVYAQAFTWATLVHINKSYYDTGSRPLCSS
jgi:hypothetical protein